MLSSWISDQMNLCDTLTLRDLTLDLSPCQTHWATHPRQSSLSLKKGAEQFTKIRRGYWW